MALAIDPDDVPGTRWLVFEDGDFDRWMAPGVVMVANPDGTSASYTLDDGAGGAYRIGTATGVLFFRLDLAAGIVTGVTGPTMDAALPADTATAVHFAIAEIASTASGDFEQIAAGPFLWQNSGRPGTWGTTPIIFTKGDGSGGRLELGRISMDRGMPVMTDTPLDIQLDGLGTEMLHGVASAPGIFIEQDYYWDAVENKWIGYVHADYVLVFNLVWELYSYTSGFPLAFLDSGDPRGTYTATEYGRDTFNDGNPWSYIVT